MRFTSLGSGSKGNATLIASQQSCVMIDCGFGLKDMQRRLESKSFLAEHISAIVVTHEHSDHIRGVAAFAKKYAIPVWLTRGTATHASISKLEAVHYIDVHASFSIGDLEVVPFPVPHDAKEPCQFVISNGKKKLGVLTDTGSITPHITQQLNACHGLILECNHDEDMLADGPYPDYLKQRVGSDYGHLNNTQAAQLLAGTDTSQLQHIVAAHISEKNNNPALAQSVLSEVLNCEYDDIILAEQDTGFDWLNL